MGKGQKSAPGHTGMIASISSLDLLLSPLRERYLCITQHGTSYAKLAAANLPAANMVEVPHEGEFSDETVIQSEEFSEKLLGKGMTAFLPSCFTSTRTNAWAQARNVTVIAPDPFLQEQLEDKLYFNEILHRYDVSVPESHVLRTAADVDENLPFPGVLQVPKSWGGLGTYFVDSHEELQNVFRQAKPTFPLLYRAFVEGFSLGVTMLIGESKSMFSSTRSQLFIPAAEGPPLFLGTQWVPRSALPPKAVKKLEAMLKKITAALRGLGFRGMANVDCVLTADEAYTIECNPRQSLCTCQMVRHPELLHGFDAMEEYIHCFTEGDVSTNKLTIPDTDFAGCVLDLDRYGREFEGRTVATPWDVGLYDIQSDSKKPCSILLSDAAEGSILLVHTVTAGTLMYVATDLGVALTGVPVAAAEPGKTKLLKESDKIFDFLAGLVRSSLA